jgi:hypothetical protein
MKSNSSSPQITPPKLEREKRDLKDINPMSLLEEISSLTPKSPLTPTLPINVLLSYGENSTDNDKLNSLKNTDDKK